MTRYHPALVALHWLLAVLIILALVAGNVLLDAMPNSDPAKIDGLRSHMTIGLAILVLMIIRLTLHVFTAKPKPVDTGMKLINLGGKAAHWVLYILVFAMCASGIAIANITGLPDIVFAGSGAALPATFDDIAPRVGHGVISKLLILVILAHLAAALWHHFLRKDGLLSRMWFGKRSAG